MIKDKFNNYPKTTKYYSKNNSPHYNPPKTVTNETIHLSAPGYRDNFNGEMISIGNRGYSWASSINEIYGTLLYFYMTSLEPQNVTHFRGYGLQLRCLSE